MSEFEEDFEPELPFTRFDPLDEARRSYDPEPFRTRTDDDSGPFRTRVGSTHGEVHAGGSTMRDVTMGGVVSQIGRAERVTISSASGWPSPEWEDVARRVCIKAFFEDLKQICSIRPVVVLLDAWERSGSDLQEWILKRIVRPLCFDTDNRPEKFSLLLAGRELPDFKQRLGDETKYNKLVKSIGSLGRWEKRHVKAFLQAYGYEDLSKEDFSVESQ